MKFLHYVLRILTITGLMLASIGSYGQLDMNFDAASLAAWSGDVGDFAINGDLQLQLNASEGGSSLIYTPVTYPDSVKWSIEVGLDFSPSNSNKLGLWLFVDEPLSTTPSGYKIEIGETGSEDAIRFIHYEEGMATTVATGPMAQVASAFDLELIIAKDIDDNWSIDTKGLMDPVPLNASMFSYNDELLPTEGFFAIECTYTGTRTDLFFFDNIKVEPLLPDTEGPTLIGVELVGASKLLLDFNEPLAVSSLIDATLSGVSVDNLDLVNALQVCANLASPVASGVETEVRISGFRDLLGNEMAETTFDIVLIEDPQPKDLLINEVLYDPNSGNDSDFVEVINTSDKILTLDNVYLGRANSSAKNVRITPGLTLQPGEIIAFANDVQEIIDTYFPTPEANLAELDITNYVNDEGNVWVKVITAEGEMTIDSFEYSDDYHSTLLTESNKEGISLERLSIESPTNDPANWFSAAETVNFATPGYANSQANASGSLPAGTVTLTDKLFSPDGDGNKDFLQINYKFDKPGYVANISVHDDGGRLETYLAQNKLLGTTGTFKWEGELPDGRLAPVGMYIIYYEIFHPDGNVIDGKEVCVLARQL